jgi:hypothetical protein
MNALALTNTEQMNPIAVGEIFAASGMFPDARDAAQCATKLIVGGGLGLNQYDSMAGLHIISGKIVLAANLMAAAIKRSGKYDYRSESTNERCSIEFLQDGKTIGVTTWTVEDARAAGLGGNNWRKYPKAMLFARCISAGYREHCPDALGNAPVYVEAHGEMEIEGVPAPAPPPSTTASLSPLSGGSGNSLPTPPAEKEVIDVEPEPPALRPTPARVEHAPLSGNVEKIPVEIISVKEGVGDRGPWTLWKVVTDDGYELETFNRTEAIDNAIADWTALEFKEVTYNQKFKAHNFKWADPVRQIQKQKQESFGELMDEAKEVFG